MSVFQESKEKLRDSPGHWLVTGAAGFIGSHLAETLVEWNQKVTGLDNFYSGTKDNLQNLKSENFTFIEGDIRDFETCRAACEGVDYVLHHAAIGSVVHSLEEPEFVNGVNVKGFQNILKACRKNDTKRIVYASSSAVYGDGGEAPRKESDELHPKSPYAEGKIQNESDAAASGLPATGLRYFNIYGLRQDPAGAYAAVVPKWIDAMMAGRVIEIYGDGETVRDFCHISDAVQANILAAMQDNQENKTSVYNIGSGQSTTLNKLFSLIGEAAEYNSEPVYRAFRAGDIRVSCADITGAEQGLGFEPSMRLKEGLQQMIRDYRRKAA